MKPLKNRFTGLEEMLKFFSHKELKECILIHIHINNSNDINNTDDLNNSIDANNSNDSNDMNHTNDTNHSNDTNNANDKNDTNIQLIQMI